MTQSFGAADWQNEIRQRLLDRAANASWSALWPEVVAARTALLDAIAPLSEEQAAWKPASDEWSVTETIRHQLPSSVGVIAIIEALAAGIDPGVGTPYDSPGDITAHEASPAFGGSFAELRDTFREHSVSFAALPARLPADADLERTFPHMYFGPLPARAWFAFQRIHDGAHLRQIEEIVGDARYPS